MSTNANVRIKRADGTETGIYVHWDGYVENTGIILQLCYNTTEKVEELLELGDISHIDTTIETCKAYHRDCGEEFNQSLQDAEFVYTFDEVEQVWYVVEEKFTRKTEAQIQLGLEYISLHQEDLLLNAIIKAQKLIDDPRAWKTDEFAESGNVTAACIAKAVEARQEIIKENNARLQAYYDAYYN